LIKGLSKISPTTPPLDGKVRLRRANDDKKNNADPIALMAPKECLIDLAKEIERRIHKTGKRKYPNPKRFLSMSYALLPTFPAISSGAKEKIMNRTKNDTANIHDTVSSLSFIDFDSEFLFSFFFLPMLK
jgi:hypothetical protein